MEEKAEDELRGEERNGAERKKSQGERERGEEERREVTASSAPCGRRKEGTKGSQPRNKSETNGRCRQRPA